MKHFKNCIIISASRKLSALCDTYMALEHKQTLALFYAQKKSIFVSFRNVFSIEILQAITIMPSLEKKLTVS